MMRDDGPDAGAVAAAVRAAWADVVHESVDPQLAFLAAGGHSLAAARLIARLNRELAVDLPMSAILRDDPTPAQLVDQVVARVERRPDAPAPKAAVDGPAPSPERSGSAPLAPSMRRIWTWHRLHPESPAYNVVRVLCVDGRIQPTALRAALADLCMRHEALRCVVVEPCPGEPEVLVGDPATVPLTVEVARPAGGDVVAAVDDLLYRIADRPFPTHTPPLWRAGVVYAPAVDRTWLVLVMHHLISDLRASDLVLNELAEAYQARAGGTEPRFATPAPSLLAHLAHEGRLRGTPRWEEQLGWWSQRLAGVGAALPLPLSAADQDEPVYAASTHSLDVPDEEVDRLDGTMGQRGFTPAIFFLTAASAVLAAWSGPDRAEVVGLPSVRISRPEDERLVGFLLDTLPLAVSVDRQQSFQRVYETVRETYADAADHALPAFDEIVDRLRLPRATGARNPLIRLWFSDLTRAAVPSHFGDQPAVEHDLPPAWSLFDLGLYLRRSSTGYRLHLVGPRGLSEPADLAALLHQIVRVATLAASDPTRPLDELLEPPAAVTAAPSLVDPRASTVDLIGRHARRRPAAVALTDQDGTVDYRSLDEQIDAVADELRSGAGSGAVVALPARRDRTFVLRLLACQRVGVTAVLVDADWPDQRRRRALEVAAVTHAFPWSGAASAASRPGAADRASDGPAHVLFTSGTTGDPLAVRVTTEAADTALADLVTLLGVTAADRVSMLSGPAHDPVLRDLGLALRTGARVCMPPPGVLGKPVRLAAWLRQERVTVMSATPTLLALVLGADRQPLPDLRVVVCGGSPLSAETAELIRSCAPDAVVVNGYGCTETPQLVVAHQIVPDQPVPPTAEVPIGVPLPGRRVEVRSAGGRRCDAGQLGEVWVAAPHIAQGYLGSTGDGRFATRDDGRRWLRTGDLARCDAAGRLHLAGRADRQVLVNGHRVMLEELESVARACAGVTDAVAQVVGYRGRQAIRIWVQRSTGASVDEDAVRAHLVAVLPASAVPARVIVVDHLDVTENLKPMAPQQEPTALEHTSGPRVDAGLRHLAESVLGRPLDLATNFFDAGFTSTSLLQLTAELGDLLGRPVEALSVFNHPNLRALDAFLFGLPARPAARAEPAGLRSDRSDRVARVGASRRQVRTWIRTSAPDSPTATGPQ
jgi:non-ribosomal peptide synthetase component F